MPDIFDPFVLADKGRTYKGNVALGRMERLQDALIDGGGDAYFEISFTKGEKIATATGRIRATLVLECQVCLETVNVAVDTEMKLGMVSSFEEARLLPDSYEPLLVKDRKLALKDLVEEELLLALPIISKHPDCRTIKPSTIEPARSESPFAILANLKQTGDQPNGSSKK